jgi:hypothetical protein
MAAESFEVLKTNFFRTGAATAGSCGGAFVKMVFQDENLQRTAGTGPYFKLFQANRRNKKNILLNLFG